ncbi:endonuclease/exonuclease/phosphatase family protein [Nonlabens xiamenensis]|uniref:endonuclease/exonuclease/phosphatase family protein n=1 Tax=Nonlabens xiamenensis TaxID=2341043 RepID=UPI000F605E43|nr:endonuclease/exonuclease/phosphatase [Nonlabens xiamenensis]
MPIPTQAFEQYTVAFYNLENFFDPDKDPNILDGAFTEFGRQQWNLTRYKKKLQKISHAISKIGFEYTGKMPSLIGVAEVENKRVLNDLLAEPKLQSIPYDYIHYNSPDERGIDTALIYDTRVFEVLESEPVNIYLEDESGVRDTTRDVLYVKGLFSGTPMHIYVNHWPSRRDGMESTNEKRIEVARQLVSHLDRQDPENRRICNDLALNDCEHVIIMGDFNDEPENDSLKKIIVPQGFDNITAPLKSYHRGSINHQFKWGLFDQILISQGLHNDIPESLYFWKAEIFDDIMLRQWKGKYRGQPARTFVGRNYKGGYSDHFPVFAIFRKN